MEARKPRHHSMPMTCKDKLERVFSGEIRQTIRRGERYQVGDTLTIFEWTGTPYRSKWGRRIDEKVKVAFPILINDLGVGVFNEGVVKNGLVNGTVVSWPSDLLDGLAMQDGVKPAKGTRLKKVLTQMHPDLDMKNGEIFQVVRW